MIHHLQLEDLRAAFVPQTSSGSLMLAVRSLSLTISREGLSSVIEALIPEQPLQVTIVDQVGPRGCVIALQATRYGFTPRITVTLAAADAVPGGILINIDPSNRWSPLDRVMLEIADRNLRKVASSQPGLSRRGASDYLLDLQSVIRDQLLDSSAPVRWDARLDRIDGSSTRIRIEFGSMVSE